MAITIEKQLVARRSTVYSGTNGRKYITIHETANTDKGAGAQTHANLQAGGFSASWHYQVDDKIAIQSFPHTIRCWHAGDGSTPTGGNYNSIAIEVCVNSDGNYKQAVKNAAELVKKIMKEEGISIGNVVQHNHWSGKNCPTRLRSGSHGVNWSKFKDAVSGSKGSSPTKNPSVSKPSASKGSLGLVDWMKSQGMNASYDNRDNLAGRYGIKNYEGSAAQNSKLLEALKKGKPSKTSSNKKGDQKTKSIVDYLASIDESSSKENRKRLAEQYGVNGYDLSAKKNTELLNAMRKGAKSNASGGSSSDSLPNATYRAKKPYPTGSGVRKVQNALASDHYYPDKGAKNDGIDGSYGPKTASAVKRYQEMHGLKADGVYGTATRKSLLENMK